MKRELYLAGGCFWGTQKFFDQFDGIISTEVGYANGKSEDPTYEQVCNDSGHAETVKILYEDFVISTAQLVEYFFMIIDPLSINKQGEDTGIQYRTGIYYTDEALVPEIKKVYDAKQQELGQKLAVELIPLESFYDAEEYHQKYLDKNPTGYCHISPALLHLKDH